MKNFSIIHILLFIVMLLAYTCAAGQTTEDYVVTNTMDTLYGKVKQMSYGPSPKVQLQTDDAKTVYSIFDIKSFTFKGEIYCPVKSNEGYSFMKQVIRGYVSLFAFRIANQSSYDGLLLQKLDGAFLEVPNLGFKKRMSLFFEDCGTVGNRIANGELSRKDLQAIVNEYNSCIDNRTLNKQTQLVTLDEVSEKSDPWKSLSDQINKTADFEGKSTAQEMVTEVINKVSKGEKVPSFVIEGLKSVLKDQTNLKASLDTALKSLEN